MGPDNFSVLLSKKVEADKMQLNIPGISAAMLNL